MVFVGPVIRWLVKLVVALRIGASPYLVRSLPCAVVCFSALYNASGCERFVFVWWSLSRKSLRIGERALCNLMWLMPHELRTAGSTLTLCRTPSFAVFQLALAAEGLHFQTSRGVYNTSVSLVGVGACRGLPRGAQAVRSQNRSHGGIWGE